MDRGLHGDVVGPLHRLGYLIEVRQGVLRENEVFRGAFDFVWCPSFSCGKPEAPKTDTIGDLIIRMWSWRALYYNYKKEPPKKYWVGLIIRPV